MQFTEIQDAFRLPMIGVMLCQCIDVENCGCFFFRPGYSGVLVDVDYKLNTHPWLIGMIVRLLILRPFKKAFCQPGVYINDVPLCSVPYRFRRQLDMQSETPSRRAPKPPPTPYL